MKLSKSEVPNLIADFFLDFEPLLEQAVQVVMLKYYFFNRIERITGVMIEQQNPISQSQRRVAELEVKAKDKNRLASTKVDILFWTQQINWLQLKIEAIEKEKEDIDASDLSSIDEELIEEAKASIERARSSRILEG